MKEKLVCHKSKLSFLANRKPRRELIPNMSKLKEGFCHRSYALWKKDLNGSSFNPQSPKEWVYRKEDKWVVYWCMPLLLPLMFLDFLYFLFLFFSFLLFYLFSFFCSSPSPFLLFTTTILYTICHGRIHHFYLLTAFSSEWASFRDYPLAYHMFNHYHYSKRVGCTTPHSQTKLLVLFFTSLCFSLLLSG